MTELGLLIQELQNRGYSCELIGRMTGYGRTSIARFASGKKVPRYEKRFRELLAAGIKKDVESLKNIVNILEGDEGYDEGYDRESLKQSGKLKKFESWSDEHLNKEILKVKENIRKGNGSVKFKRDQFRYLRKLEGALKCRYSN